MRGYITFETVNRITLLIIIDFFPNPDFCGFLKTSTPILIKVYF
ncbi:hypothetical protein [Moraxella lacunata]